MGPRTRGRRRGPARATFWGALAIAGMLGAAGGVGLEAVLALGRPTPPPSIDPAAPVAAATPTATPDASSLLPTIDRPLNVLFMATDVSWDYQGGKRVPGLRGNTDTMMLARFDPARGDTRILSIPRDTRTRIAGHGTFKINACNPYGGPTLAVSTVSTLLDTPVDRFVLINTRAVIQLVDAMGGVEVFVPRDLDYDDWAGKLHIHLKKGPNRLAGQQAHDFLRFRHDDLGDIGRVQRQQLFMQAAVRQLLTPGNLLQVPRLAGLVRANMETDLSAGEMLRLAGFARGMDGGRVRMAMLPGREGIVAGGWYWLPDEAGARRMVEGFLVADAPAELRPPGRVRVTLRDGVGDRRALARLRKALARAGYVWVEDGGLDAERGRGTTLVIAQNADEAGAQELAAAIGVGEVVVAATGALGSDVTVVMGRDWILREAAPQAAIP